MDRDRVIDFHAFPDASGHFGRYGGRFVPETLIGPLDELAAAYDAARVDPAFIAEFERDLAHYVGRPSPIYHAQRLSAEVGGARILLKREDLNHTGAHKINNTIGQALLASRMGKTRIIAETGAGQHGVASATVAARLGLECVVYMGATDIERQKINVYRMQLLGATVVPVTSGSATLKDALNEAMRDWVTNVRDTFYIIGTVAGPDPYPRMVRDFNCPTRSPRASAAAATRSASSMPSSTIATCASSAPKPRARALRRAITPPRWPLAVPACCTATEPTCCATTMGRSPKPIRCPQAWIIRVSARNMRSSRTPAVRNTSA